MTVQNPELSIFWGAKGGQRTDRGYKLKIFHFDIKSQFDNCERDLLELEFSVATW